MTGSRRRLAGILEEPGLPNEAMAAVAAKTTFDAPAAVPSAEPAAPPAAPPASAAATARKRQGAGRTHQFTTRIKPEAAVIMIGDSVARNVPIAEVLEEALADLKAKRERQAAGQGG